MNYLHITGNDQAGPQNNLQKLAFSKGLNTASAFATAVSKEGITSYGTAYSKWNGQAGNTQHKTLLAIAKFLGAKTVEDVFE